MQRCSQCPCSREEQLTTSQAVESWRVEDVRTELDVLIDCGTPYLVGDKVTYADLCFVPWNMLLPFAEGPDFEGKIEKELPAYWAWHQKLMGREAVKKIVADREAASKKH